MKKLLKWFFRKQYRIIFAPDYAPYSVILQESYWFTFWKDVDAFLNYNFAILAMNDLIEAQR